MVEGGLSNDRDDRGGITKFGVSLRFLAAEGAFDEDGDGKADFDLDMDGDIDGQDIRQLTPANAVFLFYRCFWQRLGIETLPIPAPIGEMVFDQAVNGGVVTSRKLLQRAINSCLMLIPASQCKVGLLKVDGAIGDATIAALRFVLAFPSVGTGGLATCFREAVGERYRAIVRRWPDQQKYLNGWLARADRLGK
ncbi:lysozyme family protein [Novosphingobium sp. 1748]|uniref:glycoside hydrolase family 108 protein n=1 Tax=Novosphingobium sp. 1748 TaxID=2817760 RepID=UPI002860A1C0|nr:glycosyl hydrolase 108 family protein [Novosphingobium sp. 1748]MDR6708150.1 lysozyme family protein [Novosphingobium sp. 1748]